MERERARNKGNCNLIQGSSDRGHKVRRRKEQSLAARGEPDQAVGARAYSCDERCGGTERKGEKERDSNRGRTRKRERERGKEGEVERQGETEIRKERVHWVLQPPGAVPLDDKTGIEDRCYWQAFDLFRVTRSQKRELSKYPGWS